MSNNYWQKRIANSQDRVSSKSIAEIEKKLKQYYKKVMQSTIEDAENLYARLLSKQEAGKAILASDMYRLDSYWKTVADMRNRLETLGNKECALLEKKFIEVYNNVYESIPGLPVLDSGAMFNVLSDDKVKQLINSVWCSDNKNFSQRIWGNVSNLQECLNTELTNCIISGKKTTYLKQALQDRFNVSYGQANRLVRTEVTHIQAEASLQRYKNSNVKQFQFLAAEDERTCEICGALDGKIFDINEKLPIPAHANCRCTIAPIVNINLEKE